MRGPVRTVLDEGTVNITCKLGSTGYAGDTVAASPTWVLPCGQESDRVVFIDSSGEFVNGVTTINSGWSFGCIFGPYLQVPSG